MEIMNPKTVPWARVGCILRGGIMAAMFAGCSAPKSDTRSELIIEEDEAFPESITSMRDGTLITGSVGSGGLFKAAPGELRATRWIAAGDNGLMNTFGVLADEPSNTLWVCSSSMDPPEVGAPAVEPALYNYELATGTFRSRYPLPGGNGLCNDIAVGPDKAIYVADTTVGRVLRLAQGGQALEEWSTASDLAGADGLDFLGRQLYVNSFTSGKLLRLELKADGSAGTLVVLKTSRAFTQPDGLRRLNETQFVMAEGSGEIDLLTIKGDEVDVKTLRSGLIGPAGVTVVGSTLWALESKLSQRDKPEITSAPFKAYAIELPTE